MAEFNLADLAETLKESEGTGVSFAGQGNKWGTEQEAKNLIDAINECKKLQFLNLEGNTLGVEAARGIASALEKHPEFKQALWKDLFTGRLKSEIPQALQSLGKGMITAGARLTILDCSDNALGPNGMVGLVDLIKSPTCYSLQELKLNNCGLGIDGAKMLAKALTECHTASMVAGTPFQLKVFIAGRNRLENPGATALAAVFGAVKTLEHVAIPQNGIYHVGISALSDGFRENSNMKILNLNDNTIGQKGASALADALEVMQNLVEINFGDCLLKTGGAIFIAEAVQDGHRDLEMLNLEANEIGPDGGLSIASAMHNKTNLHTLVLNGNQFGSECREQIQEILRESSRIDALGELDEDGSEDEEAADEEDLDDDEELDDEEETDEYESDTEDAGYDVSLIDKTKSLNSTANASTDNLTNNLNDTSLYFDREISRPNTVETFCITPNPTVTMFNALEDNDKTFSFRHFLQTVAEADYLIYVVFAILKCSAISLQCKDALDVAQSLYKDCYEYALKTNQVSRVNNFFLIQLGLLKHEDKEFRPAYDLTACRLALRHTIDTKVLPDDVSNMLSFFMERF